MIARVAPLRNMPRSMKGFDYLLPDEISDALPGTLVHIPFRKSDTLGLILSTQKTSDIKKTKSILGRINKTPLYTNDHLKMYSDIADFYGVSISQVLRMAAPPLQKRKLRALTLSPPSIQKHDSDPTLSYRIYKSEKERLAYLKKFKKDNSLIIVPEQRFLPSTGHVWHSSLSTPQKFELWKLTREQETESISGTRSALFLPFQKINKIVIDMAHNDNHKHWDQAPRYHTHDVAYMIAQRFNAELFFLDHSPSVAHYIYLTDDQKKEIPSFSQNVHVVSRSSTHVQGSLIAPPIIQAIENAKKNALLLLNRKGYATTVTCKKCGHTEKSPHTGLPLVYFASSNMLKCPYTGYEKRLPSLCPDCESALLLLRGAGLEKVVQLLKQTFKDRNITAIDADTKAQTLEGTANIIVGTAAALSQVAWDTIGMSAILDVDRRLAIPEYGSHERLWHTLSEIYFHSKDTPIYLQTRDEEQPFMQTLSDSALFYEESIDTRKQFSYPPHSFLTRYMFAHPNANIAREVAKKQYIQLKNALTDHAKNVTILHPLPMHPIYFRGKHWQLILCKIRHKKIYEMIPKLNALFPPQWKIDPNPIHILHP